MSTIKATPFLEEILHLATLFLKKQGYKAQAKAIQENYDLPQWVQHNNPLFEKGLVKIVKYFVKNHPQIQQYYQDRAPDSEEEQESEEQEQDRKVSKKQNDKKRREKSPKVHQKPTSPANNVQKSPMTRLRSSSPKVATNPSWMSKFSQPKKLEDINNHPPLKQTSFKAEENKAKKSKKEEKDKIQSSEYESQEDSFQLQPKKKIKKDKKAEKIEEKRKEKAKEVAKEALKEQVNGKRQKKQIKQIEEEDYEYEQAAYQKHDRTKPGYKQSFSRINKDEVGPIRSELRDNSFQAKQRYGQAADEWGSFGFDKLKDTRGDSFKKTKGKLKNKAFQGALMDVNKINSIPIL